MKFILVATFSLYLVLNGMAQIQKAAIISVFGNKNLSDNPLDTKLYSALLKDSSFDISGTVNQFEEVITEKLLPEFSFPFMEKEKIVSDPAYQNLDSIVMYPMGYYGKMINPETGQEIKDFSNPLVPADGYVNIAAFGAFATDKKAILRIFDIFPELDAVLIAYIDYNLYDGAGAFGITTKKVYANVNIKLFNNEAKRIFKLKERASSNKSATAVGGLVVDPEKLKPMIYEASEKLFAEMQTKIPKSLKKMAKKLN